MYRYEQELVNDFIQSLRNPIWGHWGILKIATEFYYARGKTDVIALTSDNLIIAFEMKLTKWRDALDQAYRNTCFAHYSYVVLPEGTSNKTLDRFEEFHRRSVGVCYLSHNQIVVPIEARYGTPIQKYLTERASQTVLKTKQYARTSGSCGSCYGNM